MDLRWTDDKDQKAFRLASLQTVFAILTSSRWIIEVIVAVAVLQGVLAIWLSLGKGKWFVRAAVACGFAGSLIAIRAYLPAVMFCISGLLTTAVLCSVRLRTKKTSVGTRPVAISPAGLCATIGLGILVAVYCINRISSIFFATGWHERISAGILIASFTTTATLAMTSRFLGGPAILLTDQANPERRSIYSLRDLLVGAAFGAVVFTIITSCLRRSEPVDATAFALLAILLAAINCLACGLVLSIQWRWRLLSAIALAALGTAIVLGSTSFQLTPATKWLTSFLWRSSKTTETLWLMLTSGTVSLAACTLMLRTAGLVAWHPTIARHPTAETAVAKTALTKPIRVRPVAKIACIVSAVALLATLAPLYRTMTGELPRPKSSQQNAADYEKLCKAMIAASTLNTQNRTIQTLRTNGMTEKANWLAESYSEIDLLVRRGVRIHLPLDTEIDRRPFAMRPMQAEQAARNLARSWTNEINSLTTPTAAKANPAASTEKTANQAVERTLGLIRFGSRMTCGGAIPMSLVGVACETRGQELLITMLPKLSNRKLMDVIGALVEIDAQRDSLESLIQNDRAWMDHTETWHARIQGINEIYAKNANSIPGNAWSPAEESLAEAIVRRDAACRLLTLHAALTIYHEDKKHYPESLDAVVPKHLSRMPIDPYSGKPFLYRKRGNAFELFAQRPSPCGVVLPRDEATSTYLWNASEIIEGTRRLPQKSKP
ncbi:hypothetical protein [Planctomycetes bacterium K23_9]|uniref:Uncharacterized protein n=1 Tax=Stieleria marina TaxID=1930275 RepID=A0A517NZ19_9BACT|nr:hypothetical protein K239x_43790 [Planctomycetes bacterium K23_9]